MEDKPSTTNRLKDSGSHVHLPLRLVSEKMSSLLKEEMQKVLFRSEGQTLKEFIEIEEPGQGRYFLCVSVSKSNDVQVSVIRCQKKQRTNSKQFLCSHLEDSYHRTEVWSLADLVLLDGMDPDTDNPCFHMHFSTVRTVQAVNCAAKYSLARTLVALSSSHCQTPLNLTNFDCDYIQSGSVYTNRGDCMVLMQICYYAFNLVCLSMCPAP
ncbi:exocyst complex component 1-like [Denticeps clupeoides]|uniref:Exocyst complex component Sec3 PIP2-binding N-terminal domain-containing protein n=1 Tax=Denticeps clupeoides TaxID=299321 RepID=A0AAY4CZ33_9TELE|nr:exocyst complex component 1-like [Denticeps clupeoides]